MDEKAEQIAARVERALTVAGRGRSTDGRLAGRTIKEYRRYQGEYERWRLRAGYPKEPTSESLAVWAGDLLQHGYATSSVRGRVTAMMSLCRERGWPVPDGVAAWSVLRGSDLTPEDRPSVKDRAGAGRADLLAVVATCEGGRRADVRDRCLVTLAWDVLASESELVALDIGHVRPGGGDGLQVLVGGAWLAVEHDHEPAAVCPVCSARGWLAVLAEAGARGGPLFRAVDKAGNVGGLGPKAGSTSPDGRLNVRGLGKIWRRRLAAAGLPAMTPRALRLGGADDDAAAGEGIVETLRRGRWSPRTAAVVQRLVSAAERAAGVGDG